MPNVTMPSPAILERLSLYVLLNLGILAFFFVVGLDFSVFANRATQIDEYYFSACAARGLEIGAIPIAGCHDNKGPLIFLVYQLIFRLSGIYNFTAVQLVPCSVVLLNTTLFAWLAFRLSGIQGGPLAASLALLAFMSEL